MQSCRFEKMFGPDGYAVLGGSMTVTSARSLPALASAHDVGLGIGTHIVSGGSPASTYLVQLPVRGALRMHFGSRDLFPVPGSAVLAPPGCPMSLHSMVACTEVVLGIDKEIFERHTPVPVPGSLPRTIDLRYGAGRAFRESVLRRDAAAQDVVALLVAALAESSPARRNAVAQVVEAVGRQPNRAHTVRELAREHGLSVRSLQRLFLRDIGMTPHEFLLSVRLDHTHRMLYESSPDSVTVSAVAQGSGFRHLGRFAQQYRATFGEVPSDTLRR